MSKHAILCLDDERDNVDALERLFRKKYRVFKATSGEQALKILEKEDVSLIISDQRMPNMTGVEFLRLSMKKHPFAVRILLTGYTDINSVIAAINSGEVYRYITKPWDPVDLSHTVDQGIEKFEMAGELKKKNEALTKALDELRTLDQAKTSFMVLVNHELKTPLTTILSFSGLLRETKLDSEQLNFVSKIEASGLKLKLIVDDVLQLISAEAGTLPVHRRKIKVNQLLGRVDEKFQVEMNKKDQKLDVDLSGEQVLTDPVIVQNVLERIVHNAIKFGDAGSIIEIKSESDGASALISVENAAPDIDSDLIEKILEPFTLNEDIMNHSRGLGLGLSLCQALLKRLESELLLNSSRHRVRASFRLPLI